MRHYQYTVTSRDVQLHAADTVLNNGLAVVGLQLTPERRTAPASAADQPPPTHCAGRTGSVRQRVLITAEQVFRVPGAGGTESVRQRVPGLSGDPGRLCWMHRIREGAMARRKAANAANVPARCC
jgi:hypothetical protein